MARELVKFVLEHLGLGGWIERRMNDATNIVYEATGVYPGEWDRAVIEMDDTPGDPVPTKGFGHLRGDRPLRMALQFQSGPVREYGRNGLQVEDVLTVLIARMQMLNQTWGCRENSIAITKLQEALMWLEARRKAREAAGVEGTDAPRPDGGDTSGLGLLKRGNAAGIDVRPHGAEGGA